MVTGESTVGSIDVTDKSAGKLLTADDLFVGGYSPV